MCTNRLKVVGVVMLFLTSAPGWTQSPDRGNFRPGGQEGGGGRPFGGRSGMGRDPNAIFDRLAQGKEVVNRSEMQPFMQSWFDRIASGMGITNGQISRQQFTAYMQQQQMQRGGGASRGPGAAPPGSGAAGAAAPSENRDTPPNFRGGRGGFNADAMADRIFRRSDQNGDGLINYDEMPEALRQERDKWDANRDGFIDATEIKAYVQARMQQPMTEGGGDGQVPGEWEGAGLVPEAAPVEEVRRPVVYRAGKLPKELPSWFAQRDTDQDAQIGLYEWKNSGRPLEEFVRLDRNNDGFVTVDEVLRHVALTKDRPSDSGSSSADGRFPGANLGPGAPSFIRGGNGPGEGGPRMGNGGEGGWRRRFGGEGGPGGGGIWNRGRGNGNRGR